MTGSHSDDVEFIVAGGSHIYAMGAPVGYEGPVSLVPAEVGHRRGFFLVEERKIVPGSFRPRPPLSSQYWDTLAAVARDRIVLLVYAGNQHHADFLFRPDPLFDFVDERTEQPFAGAVVVPRGLVRAHFAPSMAGLDSTIARLQGAGSREVRVLGTPPPQSDLARVAEHADMEVLFTPAPILQRMWSVIQELMEEAARRAGATFVPVPPETIDSQGFLGKEFYEKEDRDITHANRKYGQLILESALREPPAPANGQSI